MSKRSLVKNAGDAEQVKAAERTERRQRQQRTADLREIMATPHGRRFVRHLVLDVCGLQRSSYLNNISGRGSDPVFHEGQRFVGATVYDQVAAVCFEQWLLAEAEAYEAITKQQRHEDSSDAS